MSSSKPFLNIEVKNSKITCCENASLDSTDSELKNTKTRKSIWFSSCCCPCWSKQTHEEEEETRVKGEKENKQNSKLSDKKVN